MLSEVCVEVGSSFHQRGEERVKVLESDFIKKTCVRSRTCMEVMEAVCPCNTATGAQVRKHHTRMILSQLAEARSVFSKFTVISEISAACPRRVASRRPSSVAQIFTRQSSEPWQKHMCINLDYKSTHRTYWKKKSGLLDRPQCFMHRYLVANSAMTWKRHKVFRLFEQIKLCMACNCLCILN